MSSKSLKKEHQIIHKQEAFETRQSKRVSIQLLVDYCQKGDYLFDFCRDLGTGGIFINTKRPSQEGTELELVFTIPDSKETLELKGTVIWVQHKQSFNTDSPTGMGVQFNELSTEQRTVLEGFIERYSQKKRA